MGNVDPLAGVHVVVLTPWLSDDVGVYDTTTPGTPPLGTTFWFAGHVIVGATVSVTRIVNVHVSVLPALSVAVHVTTLGEAAENVAPRGKVYLPDGSYREMTEWALPVERQLEYDSVVHEMEHDPRWARLKRFVRGGFWRNFKVKYPESDEMYTRMFMVSNRLQAAVEAGHDRELVALARRELYRGQCNCSYWQAFHICCWRRSNGYVIYRK